MWTWCAQSSLRRLQASIMLSFRLCWCHYQLFCTFNPLRTRRILRVGFNGTCLSTYDALIFEIEQVIVWSSWSFRHRTFFWWLSSLKRQISLGMMFKCVCWSTILIHIQVWFLDVPFFQFNVRMQHIASLFTYKYQTSTSSLSECWKVFFWQSPQFMYILSTHVLSDISHSILVIVEVY